MEIWRAAKQQTHIRSTCKYASVCLFVYLHVRMWRTFCGGTKRPCVSWCFASKEKNLKAAVPTRCSSSPMHRQYGACVSRTCPGQRERRRGKKGVRGKDGVRGRDEAED